MRKFASINSSRYLLLVHLIFTVKYRKHLLVKYGDVVKAKMEEIASRNDFEIDTVEVDKNDIHLLVSYEPKVSIASMVRALKGETTHMLWENFDPHLRLHFWKKHIFSTDGYFACSVGNALQEVIRQYIENQGY
jgi:putative transposase